MKHLYSWFDSFNVRRKRNDWNHSNERKIVLLVLKWNLAPSHYRREKCENLSERDISSCKNGYACTLTGAQKCIQSTESSDSIKLNNWIIPFLWVYCILLLQFILSRLVALSLFYSFLIWLTLNQSNERVRIDFLFLFFAVFSFLTIHSSHKNKWTLVKIMPFMLSTT